MLGTPGDFEPFDAGALELVVERRAQLENRLLPLGTLGRDLGHQIAIVVGLQKLEGEVFQLGLDAGHAEPVGQRRVDFAGFESDAAASFGREVLERAHVVKPIAELDDDDPRVLGDRQQQLPVVLDLLLGARPKGQTRDLGEPIDNAGDLGAELLRDVFGANGGVFHDVVQERRGNGGAVEELLGENERHRDGVRDEVLARHPLLAPMSRRTEAERPLDQVEVEAVGVPLQHGTQVRRKLGQGARHRAPVVRDVQQPGGPPLGIGRPLP